MNGSGTQADPYQVTTCDEFMSFFDGRTSLSNKYVKIMNNLNFKEDTTWRSGFANTSGLYISNGCTIYSDTGVNLTGLQITGYYFFGRDTYGSGGTIKNVNFLSCVLKQTTIPGNQTSTSIYGNTFYNCKVSMLIKRANEMARYSTFYETRLNNCSFYIKYSYPSYTAAANSGSGSYSFYFNYFGNTGYYLNNSYVYTENCVFPGKSSEYSTYVEGLDNSSVIHNNCYIGNNATPRLYYNRNSIVYISGTSVAMSGMSGTSESANNVLVSVDNIPAITITGSNTTNCTPTQIRDKDYLISIGFLP